MSEVEVRPSDGFRKAVVIRILTRDAAEAYADLLDRATHLPGGQTDTGFRDDAVALNEAIDSVWPERQEDADG